MLVFNNRIKFFLNSLRCARLSLMEKEKSDFGGNGSRFRCLMDMLPRFRFLWSDAGCITYIITRDEEKQKNKDRPHKVYLRLCAIAAVA